MKESKYRIITIGCQMNKADSERLATQLEKSGYVLAEPNEVPDLVALVTCGVRQSAENRIYGFIPGIKKKYPNAKIIFTGCLVYREDIKKKIGKLIDYWMPINQIVITKFLMAPLSTGQAGFNKGEQRNDYLKIKSKYESKFSAFVPIGNGCDNYCSYCVVPYARGREIYRPAEEILQEVKSLVKKGYKEIILIAQNVNSYKVKSKKLTVESVDFVKLLKLINDIPGDFWIRFMTSHPKDMSDELINTVARCDKVCEYIHLPVQAGDDKILALMNRKYTVTHYKSLIKKIRKTIPGVGITTDVIVGFPSETRAQFNNTKKLFQDMKFDLAYISQYSARPLTAAVKLKDDVSKIEKTRRENELNIVVKKTGIDNNKKYLQKNVTVLIEGRSRKGGWFGKTRTNKVVKINNISLMDLTGKFVEVKIKKVIDFCFEGEIIAIRAN